MGTLVFSVSCSWFWVIRGEREQRAWKLRLGEKSKAGRDLGEEVWSWKFVRRSVKKCRAAEMQCCGLEDMRGLGISVKSNFRGLICQEIKRFL